MLAYDWNFLGLSTETKPLSGEKVVDGSTFYECDTSTFFIYYQGKWYQQTFVTEDGINFWLYKTLMKKMFGKWFDGNISLGKVIKPTTGTEIEFTNSLPAQITDLTGYGDTFQQTYTGRNILPSSGLTANTTDGITFTPVYNDNNELLYINVNGTYTGGDASVYYKVGNVSFVSGEKYTISGSTGGSGSTYRIWVSSNSTTGAFPAGNRLSSDDGPRTGTASNNENGVAVSIQVFKNKQVDNVKFYPQIEKSDTATSYEPYVGGTASPNPDYPQPVQTVTGEQTITISDGTNSQNYTVGLGTIELCKIGTYQDYIYKSGTDWYVHKEVGKYTFTGSESWQSGPYGTNSWELYNVVSIPFDTNKIQILSNIFTGIKHADRNNSGDNSIYSISNIGFYIRNTSLSTLSDVQTNTSGNYIYYALATPTDTKITDNTLISNLNSLLNYMFPAGDHQIVITADGLPMALKLTITEKE